MLNKSPSSKRKILTATLLLTLLVSALTGTLLVALGRANPIGMIYPHDPHAVITVQSPLNHAIYNVSDVTVIFSLNLTEWTPPWPDWNPDYSFSSSVTIYLHDKPVWQRIVRNSPEMHVFSVTLKELSNGVYGLTVIARTNGTYWHGTYSSDPVWGGWSWSESSVPIIDSSDVVVFTVYNSTTATSNLGKPLLTVFVSSAVVGSAAVISFGLVGYLIRHKKKRWEK